VQIETHHHVSIGVGTIFCTYRNRNPNTPNHARRILRRLRLPRKRNLTSTGPFPSSPFAGQPPRLLGSLRSTSLKTAVLAGLFGKQSAQCVLQSIQSDGELFIAHLQSISFISRGIIVHFAQFEYGQSRLVKHRCFIRPTSTPLRQSSSILSADVIIASTFQVLRVGTFQSLGLEFVQSQRRGEHVISAQRPSIGGSRIV
jgi:hypothetical protein